MEHFDQIRSAVDALAVGIAVLAVLMGGGWMVSRIEQRREDWASPLVLAGGGVAGIGFYFTVTRMLAREGGQLGSINAGVVGLVVLAVAGAGLLVALAGYLWRRWSDWSLERRCLIRAYETSEIAWQKLLADQAAAEADGLGFTLPSLFDPQYEWCTAWQAAAAAAEEAWAVTRRGEHRSRWASNDALAEFTKRVTAAETAWDDAVAQARNYRYAISEPALPDVATAYRQAGLLGRIAQVLGNLTRTEVLR